MEIKIAGRDFFSGEDHEVEALARSFDQRRDDEDEWLVDVLLADQDWDRRNRRAG